MSQLTPETVLDAYASGIFPMAESAESDSVFWVNPQRRGILPLDKFHLPRRLARDLRAEKFEIRIDIAFEEVMRGCAEPNINRTSTWINNSIIEIFAILFERSVAHSVECWLNEELVGGLYGIALGGAFFGESMFTRSRDASKIALAHLVARLIQGDYTLLDTQFVTEHLSRVGAIEISRAAYHRLLDRAMSSNADFYSLPTDTSGDDIVQLVTQTS